MSAMQTVWMTLLERDPNADISCDILLWDKPPHAEGSLQMSQSIYRDYQYSQYRYCILSRDSFSLHYIGFVRVYSFKQQPTLNVELFIYIILKRQGVVCFGHLDEKKKTNSKLDADVGCRTRIPRLVATPRAGCLFHPVWPAEMLFYYFHCVIPQFTLWMTLFNSSNDCQRKHRTSVL